MSRWPMCTPSNVPTVMTDPRASCGKPRASGIAKDQGRSQLIVGAVGDSNECFLIVEQRDPRPRSARGDRVAVNDAPQFHRINALRRQRWYARSQGPQPDYTVPDLIDRHSIGDVEWAAA